MSPRHRHEGDDRDDPAGPALIAGEAGILRGLTLEQGVTFGAVNLLGMDVECLGAPLARYVRLGCEVVVPIGVGIATRFGSKHQVTAPVGEVHHRVHAGLSAPSPYRLQQQQRGAVEVAPTLPWLRRNSSMVLALRSSVVLTSSLLYLSRECDPACSGP